MILPFLNGLLNPRLIPMTFFLVIINIICFASTFSDYMHLEKEIDQILKEPTFLATQGAAFAEMIDDKPNIFTATLQKLAQQSKGGMREVRRTLGAMALRNVEFMSQAMVYDFKGDDVALFVWREQLRKLQSLQSEHPSYQWGITSFHNDFLHMLTYQFTHSGFMHLFWNMFFLLVFGGFIEVSLGPWVVCGVYLLSGLIGAWSFSMLSGISPSPLVGASGSISGMIGLVAFGWLGRGRLRYIYGLLPVRGYYGYAFFPSWLVLIALVLPDVSGYIASVPEIGSVAYAAHLGGVAFGGGAAMLLRFFGKHQFLLVDHNRFDKVLHPVGVKRAS